MFHLADLWGEIAMDLEVMLISGKQVQELMAYGKKFFSSRKLAKGDRKGTQGERDGLSLSFPCKMCFSNNKYIFRSKSLYTVFWEMVGKKYKRVLTCSLSSSKHLIQGTNPL